MARPRMLIPPERIDTTSTFGCAFGRLEVDAVAVVIVQFCQERGTGWEPILMGELTDFARPRGVSAANLAIACRALADARYVTIGDDVVGIKRTFVATCFRAAPRR